MEKESRWRVIQKHIMTGIGYMIPIIVTVTVVSGIVQLIASIAGWNISTEDALNSTSIIVRLFAWIKQVACPGCQDLMYPVMAGYIAYSIADRQGLTGGFFGGFLAYLSGAGFLGAIFAGFIAGYTTALLKKYLIVSRKYRSVMNMVIYPTICCLIVFVATYFLINPFGNGINEFFQSFINAVGSYGEIPMVGIIAGMMAFDCGGPVNKAAFTIGFGLASTGWTLLPVAFGAMIAPVGFGLAVIIDKAILHKHLFPDDLADAGIPSLILGLFNVTEGALPILLQDPLFMIPINVIGTAIGAILGHLAGNFLPIDRTGNVLGFFIQENPLSYMLTLFAGAAIIAVLTLLRRAMIIKKQPVETKQAS